jgi:two-component system LytT family sensor kinase
VVAVDYRMPPRLMAALRLARGPRIFGYPGALVLSVAWTVVGTLAYVRQSLADPARRLDGSLLADYLTSLSCYLPWIVLSAVVFAVERRFPLGRSGTLGQSGTVRGVAVLAAVSVPVVYAAWAMTMVLAAGVQIMFRLPLDVPGLAWIIPGRDLLGHQSLYWSSVGASCMLRTLLEARENERRAARLMLEKSQLETSLRQAELDALRMRLQPHFLFNSIQNISVLTQHDPQTGSRMLTKLGELLRASLGRDGRPETTLQAEIALTNAYLAVEQMRFGNRLSSLVDVAAGTESALVPTFLLQPLVENAIRHGLQRVREQGIVVIRSRHDNGALVLTVTDNGAGPPAAPLSERALGIGLGATCERLARMYPDRHTFSMRAVAEGGTEVRITLPLKFEAATEVPDHAHAAAADC